MAFQPVPDVAQVNVVYTYNGEPVLNSFYGKLDGGYTLADLTALAVATDLKVGGNWLALQPSEAVYVRTEVRGLAVENDLIATANANAGPGVDLGEGLPNNVTLSLKKQSGFTGRSARGRTFWIGIPRSSLLDSDENFFKSFSVTAIVAAIEQIRSGINATLAWDAVLVSRFTGGLQRPFGITFPWASTVAVNERVDTLRGRLP